MEYRVNHTTKYQYTEAVPVCQNMVHLSPLNTNGQTCTAHNIVIYPEPSHRGVRIDYYGNRVEYFSIHQAHRRLTITAQSTIHVGALKPAAESPPWEEVVTALRSDRSESGIAGYQFSFDSPRIKSAKNLTDYARESFESGRPVHEGAAELTARIHEDFRYDSSATTVDSPLQTVFKERHGVCQDFAHVAIGCLRSLGLPARYVSGYLRTNPPPGKPRLVGADASHAWFSVYAGSAGWLDYDPTNNIPRSVDHITLARGRDYGDVCPIQGIFVGGGRHTMSVGVDVLSENDKS